MPCHQSKSRIAENGLSTLGNTFKVAEADTILSGDYADLTLQETGLLIKLPREWWGDSRPFCKFLYGTRFNIVNDEDHEKFYISYKKDLGNLSFGIKYIDSSIDVNDNLNALLPSSIIHV